jgi:hypothetical protein
MRKCVPTMSYLPTVMQQCVPTMGTKDFHCFATITPSHADCLHPRKTMADRHGQAGVHALA